MAKLTLKPDQKVEAAFYKIDVTLARRLEGGYSDDDLATMRFHVPVTPGGTPETSALNTIGNALMALRQTFEDVYGPVIPAPVPEVAKEPEYESPMLVDVPFLKVEV